MTPKSVPGSNSKGFTLVELMVTIAIGAMLLAIATPSYLTHVRKSRRTEAKAALLDLASREERYMSTNNAYSNVAANLGYSALPTTVGNGYYQMTVPAPVAVTATAPASFTTTATPVAGKGQDKDLSCASFTVDSTGKQSSVNSAGADSSSICWN
jgi:type IV pilus assembly protein PilE